MEFDEHDDPDEEMEIPTGPPGYDSTSTAARPITNSEVVGVVGGGGGASSNSRNLSRGSVRYRECLKNHAVNIGGDAVDGCCEFMAAGEEGSIDALRCAACNCHRNFHRKEITNSSSSPTAAAADRHHSQNFLYHRHHHHHQNFPSGYYRSPPPPSGYLHLRPLALPGVSGGGRDEGEDHMSIPSSSGGGGSGGGGGGSSSKKRFRTKFTQEQKEKMLAFAESVGWRIQKHDEAALEQFCADTGVRRQVLKVWMHNNKHTLGKKP